jgi:hypothetical protein
VFAVALLLVRGGADRIDARVGNDFVDGRRDTVDGGSERDVVTADRLDRLDPTCEKVLR